MSCIVCDPEIARAVRENRLIRKNIGKPVFRSEAIVDVHCPNCDSRARLRAFATIINRSSEFIDPEVPLLIVSASAAERKLYEQHWRNITHVSLYSPWGDPQCKTGIDITNMPSIASTTYGTTIAINVLDYIPNANEAIAEFARVLAKGGTLLYFIQPFRLDPELEGMKIMHRNAHSEAYHKNSTEQTNVPDCHFNPNLMAAWAREAGLTHSKLQIFDDISEMVTDIYVARKH